MRLFLGLVLMAVLGNIAFAVADTNISAFLGWLTALFWFPYSSLKSGK